MNLVLTYMHKEFFSHLLTRILFMLLTYSLRTVQTTAGGTPFSGTWTLWRSV